VQELQELQGGLLGAQVGQCDVAVLAVLCSPVVILALLQQRNVCVGGVVFGCCSALPRCLTDQGDRLALLLMV